MSEMAQPLPQPPHGPHPGAIRGSDSENIGDVLASIRQLIAQEDGLPDFAPRASRADSQGVIRPTLPLGPGSERLRGVIEQELAALEGAVGARAPSAPLILAHDAMVPVASVTELKEEKDMNIAELHPIEADRPACEGFDLFATDTDEGEAAASGGSALRNLVRDVIRQELQGEMGEHISRNLRRAVRQEVSATISAGLKG